MGRREVTAQNRKPIRAPQPPDDSTRSLVVAGFEGWEREAVNANLFNSPTLRPRFT